MEGYVMQAIYDGGEDRWTIEFHGGTSELPTHGPTLLVKQRGNTEFARNFVIALVDLYEAANKPMFDPESPRNPLPEQQGPDPKITWRDWLAYFRYNYEWQLSAYSPDEVRVIPRAGEEPWEEEESLNYAEAVREMILLRKSKFHPNYYDPGRYDAFPDTTDVTTALAHVDGFLVDFDPEFEPPPVEPLIPVQQTPVKRLIRRRRPRGPWPRQKGDQPLHKTAVDQAPGEVPEETPQASDD